jgi:hypothetical protein
MYPVSGITWPKALAYCRYRGKDLPTLFQWEKAAKPSVWAPFGDVFPWGLLGPKDVARRANADSTGLAPVNSFEFGMSSFGVYNMAGNAAEWIRNRYDNGFTVAGGAWNEPIHSFLLYSARPDLYSSETLGCRCALTAGPTPHDQGGMPLLSNGEVLDYPVSSDRELGGSAARYAYEHTSLNAAIVSVQESASWRREEIVFDGQGGQRAKAFLYLPRNAAPLYQVIHYLSGVAWWFGVPVNEVVEAGGARLSPYLRAGRAVFLVVLEGFNSRESERLAHAVDLNYATFNLGSADYREGLVSWVRDMQRGFDYLETRPDIDTRRVALWNDSTYPVGLVVAAVNRRYSSVILVGSGTSPELYHMPADINPDQIAVEPLFQLLPSPKKRVRFEGGHMPPPEVAVPIINGFLDETLGPVRR